MEKKWCVAEISAVWLAIIQCRVAPEQNRQCRAAQVESIDTPLIDSSAPDTCTTHLFTGWAYRQALHSAVLAAWQGLQSVSEKQHTQKVNVRQKDRKHL